ncbi:MAG: hypothetical protein RLZZ58_1523, partial [Pseudomonadota bacterium]
MDIRFVAQIDGSAPIVAFPVTKGGVDKLAGALGDPHGALLKGAAGQARFDGAVASLVETSAVEGDDVVRLVLVGVGEGTAADMERAGAALTARFHTSGQTSALVDFAGVDAL